MSFAQLEEDALRTLVQALAHPVYPAHAVALASVSVKAYRTLQPMLTALRTTTDGVRALCRKMDTTTAALAVEAQIEWHCRELDVADCHTLNLLIRMGFLNACERLSLPGNRIGSEGLRLIADALLSGGVGRTWARHEAHRCLPLPNCERVSLSYNQIGNEGIVALAAAIRKGALPTCTKVFLAANPGKAAPVRDALMERSQRWNVDEMSAGLRMDMGLTDERRRESHS
eukprot:7024471-Prymnesium_polylepis.1